MSSDASHNNGLTQSRTKTATVITWGSVSLIHKWLHTKWKGNLEKQQQNSVYHSVWHYRFLWICILNFSQLKALDQSLEKESVKSEIRSWGFCCCCCCFLWRPHWAQGFLLALETGLTPGSAQRTTRVAGIKATSAVSKASHYPLTVLWSLTKELFYKHLFWWSTLENHFHWWLEHSSLTYIL